MRELEAPGRHGIRNYVIFAILTIGLICTAAITLGKRAAREKWSGVLSFGLSPESCSLSGSLIKLPDISDASGLVASRRSPDLLWTHEDSRPTLFAYDVLGRLKGRVNLTQAPIQDWEDLATGPCDGGTCLYVADIGDNRGRRDHVSVYRFPEPSPSDDATLPAEAFHATYPEGPQDAEALFVSKDGGVYVVTKGNSGPVVLYRFPSPLRAGASVALERVATLSAAEVPRNDRVTGAATSPDGRWVVLRTHNSVLFYAASQLLGGDPPRPLRYDIGMLQESQAEGVAVGGDGSLFLISEGGGSHAPATLAHGVCKLPS